MPSSTTFTVFKLGNASDMDVSEGDSYADDASDLTGLTFGGVGNALAGEVATLTPISYSGGDTNLYDQDNDTSADTFAIDGITKTFDSVAVFNATITYTDGTTASITAVVFQDTNGDLYLAPESSDNSDTAALEAKPILSLTLGTVSNNQFGGLSAVRFQSDFVTCFTPGTMIATPTGDRPIESLCVGDLVTTLDSGAQRIRWITARTVRAKGNLRPIEFLPGSLGKGLPSAPLTVSRQHRMLIRSRVAERMFNIDEVLVPAVRFKGAPLVREVTDIKTVTYWHFICDKHEVVFANNAPSETLFLGENAKKTLPSKSLDEIFSIFPELEKNNPDFARIVPPSKMQRKLLERIGRNERTFVEVGAMRNSR